MRIAPGRCRFCHNVVLDAVLFYISSCETDGRSYHVWSIEYRPPVGCVQQMPRLRWLGSKQAGYFYHRRFTRLSETLIRKIAGA